MHEVAPMTERIQRIRQHYRTTKPEIDIHRFKLVTEFYQANPNLTGILRKAYSLKNLFENMPTPIFEDEIIVGFPAEMYRGCALFPETSISWLHDEIDNIENRKTDPYDIKENVRSYIKEHLDYWDTHCNSALVEAYLPDEFKESFYAARVLTFNKTGNCQSPIGHYCGNFWKVVDPGIGAIRDEAKAKRKALVEKGIQGDEARQYEFYKAVELVTDGLCTYVKRYAKEAERQAAACTEPKRKAELEKMADSLNWIMENPARDYQEAIQAVWFYQLGQILDAQLHGISMGRVDMYVGKYAEADIAAEETIREEVGDPRCGIALIGPAGENKSYMAAVMNDSHRAAGRGGSGAVMGSKNLKAVVCSGNVQIPVADKDEVIRQNKEAGLWQKGPVAPVFEAMSQLGTSSMYDGSMYSGDGGVRNWLGSVLELTDEQLKPLTGAEMDKLYRKKKFACNACPLGCGAIYEVLDSKYHITDTGRPEYETLGQFGALMMNDDAVVVNECNYLCNEYGFDTISAGGTIAWLMECYNNGLFTIDELDGIDLKWGNAQAILAMMEKLCANEGIGAKLLNGSEYAAKKVFGKGEESLVVASGIELAQHDSRWSPGLARTHKYDPTPGRHVKGGLGSHQGNDPAEDKFNYADKGERDVTGVCVNEITHAAGYCLFTDFALPPRAYMDFIKAITGFEYEGEEGFQQLGRRMYAMRHAFNLREGLRRKDFTQSARIEGRPALKEGPNAGVTVDVELMQDNVMKVLGWDVETGMIPKEVLESYGGMENVIAALYPEN